MHRQRFGWFLIAIATELIGLGQLGPTRVLAAVSDGITVQADCDSGNGSFTWSSLGLQRPMMNRLAVDGETIADPATPAAGGIGAAICASQANGRMVGVSIFRKDADGSSHQDLTGALTPSGKPVTSSSKIELSFNSLGSNATSFSFALVHGVVSTWTTTDLGTGSATVALTVSPTRKTNGSGDEFNLCTATPPKCQANQSQFDLLGAGLAMVFDSNYGQTVRGSYFGLTSAMGGFVEVKSDPDGTKSLVATLGAPHLLADGSANVGSLQAFLPTSVLEKLFGLPAGGVDTSSLAVTRTESDTSSTVPFTVTPVSGGVVVGLTDITFSSPSYTIKRSAAAASSSAAAPATTTSSSSSAKTASSTTATTPKLTPDTTKSYLRVDGQHVAADGTATYQLTVSVRDSKGTVITDQKPTLTASAAANVKISDLTLSGNDWIATLTSTIPGEKTITVKVGDVEIGTASMTFVDAVYTTQSGLESAKKITRPNAAKSWIMAVSLAGLLIILIYVFSKTSAGQRFLARFK